MRPATGASITVKTHQNAVTHVLLCAAVLCDAIEWGGWLFGGVAKSKKCLGVGVGVGFGVGLNLGVGFGVRCGFGFSRLGLGFAVGGVLGFSVGCYVFPVRASAQGSRLDALKGFQGTTPLPGTRWRISFLCVFTVKTACAGRLVHAKCPLSSLPAYLRCFGPFFSFRAAWPDSLRIYGSFLNCCGARAFLRSIMASLVFDDSLALWLDFVFSAFFFSRFTVYSSNFDFFLIFLTLFTALRPFSGRLRDPAF